MASDKRNDRATNYLGDLYLEGKYINRNLIKAAKLFMKSNSVYEFREIMNEIFDFNNSNFDYYNIKALIKIIENEKFETMYSAAPFTLQLIRKILKEKVDLLELHYKLSPGNDGFKEAKNDFLGLIAQQ